MVQVCGLHICHFEVLDSILMINVFVGRFMEPEEAKDFYRQMLEYYCSDPSPYKELTAVMKVRMAKMLKATLLFVW